MGGTGGCKVNGQARNRSAPPLSGRSLHLPPISARRPAAPAGLEAVLDGQAAALSGDVDFVHLEHRAPAARLTP